MSSFPPNQHPAESENFAAAPDGDDDASPNQTNNHQPAATEGKRRRRSGIGRGSKKRKQKKPRLPGGTVATFPGRRDDNAGGVPLEAEGGGEATTPGIQKKNSKATQKKQKKSMQNKLYYEKQKTAMKDEVINDLEEQLEVHEENESFFEDLLEQHTKAAAAAQAEAEAALDKLNKIKERHTTFQQKREKKLSQVKKKAKKQAEANEKQHQQELLQQKSQHIRESRGLKKTVVGLESQLENKDKEAWKASALMEEHHEKEMKRTAEQHEIETMKSSREHNQEVAQLQSAAYIQSREATKVEVALQGQLKEAVAQKEDAEAEKETAVREAVRKTKAEERQHYATVVEGEKAKAATLQSRLDDARKLTTSLLNRSVTAEREAKRSSREANQSAKRSRDVMEAAGNYKDELKEMENENDALKGALGELQSLVDDYEKKLDAAEAAIPIKVIKKRRDGKSGRPRWGVEVWELILEQLVNGTPPSSVNDNIIAHVKKFSPTTKIKELPSIWTIRRARSVLLVIVQTLSAYRLGLADKWPQLFHDATSRRQVSFQNLVISIEEDELFKPLLISSCIFPEDERSETVCKSIIDTIAEKRVLLREWRKVHEAKFGVDSHNIPEESRLHIAKLDKAVVNSDTCNAARKATALIIEEVEAAARERAELDGRDPSEVMVLQQDCHHHLRNVWFGAITKRLSDYLDDLLAADLDAINFRYRVSTKMDAVLRAIDKEFSLPANYPKGHGDHFKHWLKREHPGALLVPVQRTSGSRQDLAVEGAAAVYWNRKYYVQFLDEELVGKDNILQENLYTVLTSEEMIALCRVFAILHYTICLPMRFLAGNSHNIGAQGYDWSTRSMGNAIDALEKAMIEIESDGSKLLSEDFMGNIFSNIYNDGPLEPLTEFMTFMFEEKQTPTIDGSKVLPFDQLKAELFYPQRIENKATDNLVAKMAVEVAQCMLTELRDPKKATSDYLTSADGKFSWGYTTQEEHHACIGKMATNDPAESPFAQLTRQLQNFGRVLGIHASAVGHARMNGDFKRDINNPTVDGAYHKLSKEMRESLILFALSAAPGVRAAERVALEKQREAKSEKQEMLKRRKFVAAQEEYAKALTYIEMYHSAACWRTAEEATDRFSALTSDTARKNAVKEQIRMRVIGFGWKDLHVPWSENGRDFSAEELRDKLINTIIAAEADRVVPSVPPVKLPSRKKMQQLGTQSKDVALLEARKDKEKEAFVEGANELREKMEEGGIVDRYEKKQPDRPKIDDQLINVKMEQLWYFTETDGSIVPQWCQGVIIGVKKNNKVRIQWEKQSLRDGDAPISDQKFLKSKYNKHVEEAWRFVL